MEGCNVKLDFGSESQSVSAISTTSKKEVTRKSHFLMCTAASSNKHVSKKQTEGASEPKRSQSAGVKKRPTKPTSPKFISQARSNRANETKLSSEEMAALQVAEERKKAEMVIKRNQRLFMVLKSKGVIPTTVRSTKELTIPVTPHSNVETRLTLREGYKPAAPAQCRRDTEEPVKPKPAARTGPTQPLPFQLSTDARAKVRGDGQTCKSAVAHTAGEMMQKFQSNSRHYDVSSGPASTKPTIPVSPKFHRSMSSGRPKPLSRDEQEEQEMEEAKKHVFKARPVNHKVFESMGEYGVPKVLAKQVTQPEAFRLLSNHRASYRATLSTESSGQAVGEAAHSSSFKARPMPSFSSDPRSHIRRGTSKVTEAHSPKLNGGTRASSAPARRQRPSHVEEENRRRQEAERWKEVVKRQLHLTEPDEFHLRTEQRGLVAESALNARIQKQLEDERAQAAIHARPFPEQIFKKAYVPKPAEERPLTEVEAFHLATEDRHIKALAKMQEIMKENQAPAHEFHAMPVPKSLYKPSMTVEPSPRVPLTPKEVNLRSDARAEQRRSFDENVMKAALELQRQKDEEEQKKLMAEKIEMKLLRQKSIAEGGMCFVATPVMREDPFPTKHVEPARLTEPESPHLRTAERARDAQPV